MYAHRGKRQKLASSLFDVATKLTKWPRPRALALLYPPQDTSHIDASGVGRSLQSAARAEAAYDAHPRFVGEFGSSPRHRSDLSAVWIYPSAPQKSARLYCPAPHRIAEQGTVRHQSRSLPRASVTMTTWAIFRHTEPHRLCVRQLAAIDADEPAVAGDQDRGVLEIEHTMNIAGKCDQVAGRSNPLTRVISR